MLLFFSSSISQIPRGGSNGRPAVEGGPPQPWSNGNPGPRVGGPLRSQSSDSINEEPTPQYSDHLRNSSYSLLQPQSLMTYQYHQPPASSTANMSSGATSLPYISRSLSIDAYTQQQLEKRSQKCSELEEYAKRYESFSKRRGNSTSNTSRMLWQRSCNPVPEEDLSSEYRSMYPAVDYGRESVTSNSSNETLRYRDSLDEQPLVQPPSEFLNNNYKDLKRFPLQTYASEQSLKKLPECTNKSVPNLQDPTNMQDSMQAADQSMQQDQNYSYLDPDKRLRVSDNTLKLIQKQALLDYYERHKPSTCSASGAASMILERSGSASQIDPADSGAGGWIDPDSGFYSPTDQRPPSAVINGEDHPDTSSTRLNGLELEVRWDLWK